MTCVSGCENPASFCRSFLLLIVISVLTGVLFEPPPPLTKKQLLRTIDANATEGATGASRRVAVGTNICIDLIVPATDFFTANAALPQRTSASSSEASEPDSHIVSEQDLVDTFAHFFERAAAAERFVEKGLFDKLVQSALHLESTTKRLGGNAALMGNQLAKRGHSVFMSSNGDADLVELVHERVSFSAGRDAATEMHIILEYSADDGFQGLRSTRANRFILSPATAPSIAQLEAWSAGVASSVDAVVFSGLHLFESSTPAVWQPYLAAARASLEGRNAAVPQHLELASLSNEALTKDIVATLFPVVSSIGLNEEELGALFFALGGSYDDLPGKPCNPLRDAEAKRHRILRWNIVKRAIKLLQLDGLLAEVEPPEVPPCLLGTTPSVPAVAAALDYVFRAAKAKGSAVSRIHFHSLSYHIVATAREDQGAGLRRWSNTLAAVASGSVAATCVRRPEESGAGWIGERVLRRRMCLPAFRPSCLHACLRAFLAGRPHRPPTHRAALQRDAPLGVPTKARNCCVVLRGCAPACGLTIPLTLARRWLLRLSPSINHTVADTRPATSPATQACTATTCSCWRPRSWTRTAQAQTCARWPRARRCTCGRRRACATRSPPCWCARTLT
jgi:hypothetical protein